MMLKRQRAFRSLLVGYCIALAVVAFWPVPVDQPFSARLVFVLENLHRLGVPDWFDYPLVELSANMAIFFPVGALVSLLLPRQDWWRAVLVGAGTSVFIELGQLLFLATRHPSITDVVGNTFGALLGAGTALGVRSIIAHLGVRNRWHQPRTVAERPVPNG